MPKSRLVVKEVIIIGNGKHPVGTKAKACRILKRKSRHDLTRKIGVDYVFNPKWSRGRGEGYTTQMTGQEFLDTHCSRSRRKR